MAEGGVLVTESSSDGDSSGGYLRSRRWRQLKRRKRGRLRRGLPEPLEVIDLTGDDMIVRTTACNDFGVIDLTEAEENIAGPLHASCYTDQGLKHSSPVSKHPVYSPKILTPIKTENKLDMPLGLWDRDCEQPSPQGDTGKKQPFFQCSSFSLISSYGGDSDSSSHTTYNSDLGSLGSPQLGSDVFSFSPSTDSSECQAFLDSVEEAPGTCLSKEEPKPQSSPLHQRCSPSPIPYCSPMSISPFLAEADQPLQEANNAAPSAVKLDIQETAKQIDLKIWLKTLQYFQGVPVHHPFLQNVVQEKDASQKKQMNPQPITSRRLSMVSSTIEENFFQGTLDFLMDYVSCQYYPPKEITSCVVRQILLSPERKDVQQETQKDAYMLLMKIQALHPAKADSVVWDWELLREVMEEQEETFPGRLLFLQYVIQTLEDDFQRMSRTGVLHKSIAKAVLSCDQCFSNVKEVTEWLVAAVMGVRINQYRRNLQKARSPSLETSRDMSSNSITKLHLKQTAQTDDIIPSFQSQKEVPFLQRMLSIAIEVDKSPNCSALKIVHMVFSSLLNIPKHYQRQAFLSSMECHLLRCKVLELIFQHNCNTPTDLPLSVKKILHFLEHFSLLLTYQDNEVTWLRWDEMLHQLILLLLSYRSVVLGHLRSSVCERVNLIINAAKPKLQSNDCVERNSVECKIKDFQKQLSQTLGQPIPPPIKDKIELLQVLLLTAMDN
ncbi:SUMO-interacting motif-containing protein 1 isoform X2 [Rhineura floridana]|uniref:SUMO-interacting motif-containing protein 1 isoform X2 n=1 Tax=Rhineura floridana TaxID=261503 RepID=UPI002AC88CC7|nr:SUMO-interacting motif-containing protein 1 isoform X2 [Rhineura floridana]